MKKLILKKKPKRIKLFKKEKYKGADAFHNFLDKRLLFYDEQFKKLPPLENNKKYHYKERMPPNDFKLKITIFSEFGETQLPSAVYLQHLITVGEWFKFKVLYPYWMIKKNNKIKLRRK